MGFFGYTAPQWSGKGPKPPPQPRHKRVVDPDAAIAHAGVLLDHYVLCMTIEAPAYSGGLLDAWPNEALEAWPIFEQEFFHLKAYAEHVEGR